ncbi:MAG: hypothetical protein V9E87_09535 [Gemmatimonadales bacterium]
MAVAVARQPHHAAVATGDREGEHLIAHRAEAGTQRAGGGGREDGADGAVGASGGIERDPAVAIPQAVPQDVERDAGLDARCVFRLLDAEAVVEAASRNGQVGWRGVGAPGAAPFDRHEPRLVVGEPENAGHRLGRGGSGDEPSVAIGAHGIGADGRGDAVEAGLAHADSRRGSAGGRAGAAVIPGR